MHVNVNQLNTSNMEEGAGGVGNSPSSPTLVCTPLLGTTITQMLIDMQRAKGIGADLIEIRLDCLRSFNPRPDLETLLKQSPLPTIVTYRYS